MVRGSFKSENALERRQQEARRIKEKHPERVPVIVEKAAKCNLPDIEKKKYLVPGDLTAGQFMYVVRKRIKLSADMAVFIFTPKNIIPPQSALISSIYEENVDDDGFLYLTYSGESAFGSLLEEDLCE